MENIKDFYVYALVLHGSKTNSPIVVVLYAQFQL